LLIFCYFLKFLLIFYNFSHFFPPTIAFDAKIYPTHFAQSLQLNTPISIFTPKTHLRPPEIPPKINHFSIILDNSSP
jgi:hypothetical protein